MRCIILIVLLSIYHSLLGQISDIEKDFIIERTIEFLGESNEDNDVDYTTFIEDYYLFLDNPINLNQAVFEDLSRLNLLSDIQIGAILDYRFRNKEMLSIYELGAIIELDIETINIILPFIYVGNIVETKINWNNVLKYGKHDILGRYQRVLESKSGYEDYPDSVIEINPNKVYLGNPDRYYFRHRYTYKNRLSYGITGEKDAGETFFKADNKSGFDFYSAHVMLNDIGIFKKIVVGDYHANFGQGLNIWSGFNMGRTVQTLKVKQFGTGLRPYTSANENQFFRGVGITLDFNRFETTIFGSYKRIDASVSDQDTLDSNVAVENFQLTGYHRTMREVENKNKIGELVFGVATSFQSESLKINLTGLYSNYSNPLMERSSLYNQFSYNGQSQFSIGIDYQYFVSKVSFFGEVSSGLNARVNAINGILWRVDPKLDLVAVHRYFDKENQNLFGNNFSRSSQNTKGIYVGAKTRLTSKIKVSAFYDHSRSDWFRYLIDGPSAERSFLGQINYSINRYSSVYLRYRVRLKERNVSKNDASITSQVDEKTQNIRLHYSQRINDQFSVKSRLEFSKYLFNNKKSEGLLLYQDIIFRFKEWPLKLYGRYGLFDTDDYSSRIYAYENDLLYVFSVPGLFYQGFRTYIMAKYEIGSSIDIWLRWSRTSYTNQSTISSGLEQINEPFKSEIKAQIKVRF
ncbi:MAG: ComEA family DNA-binding protein [Crocinitomicaceae bacterium]